MRPRYVVLLTSSESALPKSILISILNAPITPLESALASHSHLIENTATLSRSESALTTFSPASPLESALTKNTGGGAHSSDSATRHSPLIARHYTQVLCFHTIAHSFALSCAHENANSFVFKRFRTLRQKTQPPGGILLTSHSPAQRLCGNPSFTGPPACPEHERRVSASSPVTGHESPVANRCIIPPREHPPDCRRVPRTGLPSRKRNHHS